MRIVITLSVMLAFASAALAGEPCPYRSREVWQQIVPKRYQDRSCKAKKLCPGSQDRFHQYRNVLGHSPGIKSPQQETVSHCGYFCRTANQRSIVSGLEYIIPVKKCTPFHAGQTV